MFSSSLSFGGYGASQADVAMEPSGTQMTPNKERGEEMLLPVTVKMIDAAVTASGGEDGELRIDGKTINTILIVGRVADMNKHSTAIEFSVNDSTGKMRARYYFSPEMQKTLEKVENNTYVTIVGIVKMKPSPHVSVLTMRPIESPDEISYHEISIAYASLKSKKKGSTGSGVPAFSKMVSSPPRTETPLHSVVTPLRRNEEQTKESPTQAPPMMTTPPKNEGPLKDRISKFLAEQQSPEGVAMKNLCQSFCDSKAEDVKASIAELLDEGMAYTTIDDDHFACV